MDACDKWIPHGSALGPVRFNTVISDLEVVIERTLVKFADDFQLGRTVNMLEGRAAVQRDPGRLEEGANGNLMKYNKNCT